MSRKASFLLAHSAFQEFLASSARWKQWRRVNHIDEPNGLFVTASTYGLARLDHVAAATLSDDDVVEEELSEKFQSMSNGAFSKRILPVNGRVWDKAIAAFSQVEYLARNDGNDEDGSEGTSWDLDINVLVDFAAAMHWNLALVVSKDAETQDMKIYKALEQENPDFSLEIMK